MIFGKDEKIIHTKNDIQYNETIIQTIKQNDIQYNELIIQTTKCYTI